jgi:AAA domain
MRDVSADILEWSQERPLWQREGLRRIFTSKELSSKDFTELADLCKAGRGLSEPLASEPLGAEHLSLNSGASSAVTLVSITHHRGVNALAPEQTITFGPKLTVVYGPNSAGKSGYIRILKRACRSRGIEEVLGNVLSGEAPLKAEATIRFREGSGEVTYLWGSSAPSSVALSRVSVFDSHCASVYLKDKTDVAFRPFGLDVFDKLSGACAQVRAILEAEQSKLNMTLANFPNLTAGTRARTLLDNLSSLTKAEAVSELCELSSSEEKRLRELRTKQQDLRASDPKQRGRELRLKSERFKQIMQHVQKLSEVFADSKISGLRSAAETVRGSKQAVLVIQKAALTVDMIPQTGDRGWKEMWEASVSFANAAFPGEPFPSNTAGARCPLCQQLIGPDAASRLTHFAEFVASQAQADLHDAEEAYQVALSETELVVSPANLALLLKEVLEEHPELADRVESFLNEAAVLQREIKAAAIGTGGLPDRGIGASPAGGLSVAISTLMERAAQLETEQTALDPDATAELNELESRVTLKGSLQEIIKEIERKRRLAAYAQCLGDTTTQGITRKSTELTKELITEHLRNTFQTELVKIGFNHLAVEIQVAGGTKGSLFHRLVFASAPSVGVSEVLSEGESRTLSLAAFLTELSTAGARSAIIFDDPVSSLDHVWRERIARRLVAEASQRQVIVFTHDLLFLRTLMDESSRQNVDCQHQYVRRDGNAGICSPDLPWVAMNVKDRIGALRSRWQSAEKTYRTSGADVYETEARDIYGLLREAWERAITEILLNDVVERYRPSIQTQKVRCLHDITEQDCKGVEEGMTECSRWIRGHDQAAADGTPFPSPSDLKQRIEDLDAWVKTIRKRRT